MVKLAFVLLPLIILAIGCTRTKEVIVEQTVIVERTVIVVVTATPEPFLFTRLPLAGSRLGQSGVERVETEGVSLIS